MNVNPALRKPPTEYVPPPLDVPVPLRPLLEDICEGISGPEEEEETAAWRKTIPAKIADYTIHLFMLPYTNKNNKMDFSSLTWQIHETTIVLDQESLQHPDAICAAIPALFKKAIQNSDLERMLTRAMPNVAYRVEVNFYGGGSKPSTTHFGTLPLNICEQKFPKPAKDKDEAKMPSKTDK